MAANLCSAPRPPILLFAFSLPAEETRGRLECARMCVCVCAAIQATDKQARIEPPPPTPPPNHTTSLRHLLQNGREDWWKKKNSERKKKMSLCLTPLLSVALNPLRQTPSTTNMAPPSPKHGQVQQPIGSFNPFRTNLICSLAKAQGNIDPVIISPERERKERWREVARIVSPPSRGSYPHS